MSTKPEAFRMGSWNEGGPPHGKVFRTRKGNEVVIFSYDAGKEEARGVYCNTQKPVRVDPAHLVDEEPGERCDICAGNHFTDDHDPGVGEGT